MATISFITKFNLVPTVPLFIFIDTSDYAGQSISTSNVNGCFKIISPSGITIYDNTDFSDANCDIKISTSTTNRTTIQLPVDNAGLVEVGEYQVIYSVYDKNLTLTYSQTNEYDNEYVKPEIVIKQDVDCISQIFGQTDSTNYVVNGITPTLSRLNTLYYPSGVKGGAPSPIVVTSDTLRTTTFFNGTQTSTIVTLVTYTFIDGLIVLDSLFASKEVLVDCSYYCSIACGLKDYERKKESFRGRNQVEFEKYDENFKEAMSYVALIRLIIECGGGKNISAYLDRIKDIIGNCNCGCDGDDDDPNSRVTGWGSLIGADGTDGTDGVDGSTWYSGTTAPSSGTGITGDWYVNTVTGDIYTKTSTTIWTLKLNIKGASGADGSEVLVNDTTISAPVSNLGVNVPHTFKTYTLPLNTLKTNGDILEVVILATTVRETTNTCFSGSNVLLSINGTSATPSIVPNTSSTTTHSIPILNTSVFTEMKAIITRLSATTVLVSWDVTESSATFVKSTGYAWMEPSVITANLTTNTNVINVDVYSNAVTGSTSQTSIAINQLLIKYIAI
jgi:hypothetical protein